MKKGYIVILAIVGTLTSFGQEFKQMHTVKNTGDSQIQLEHLPSYMINGFGENSEREIQSTWIDYPTSYKEEYGSQLALYYGPYLTPDSTVIAVYGQDSIWWWVHNIAQTVDLNSSILTDRFDGYNFDTGYDITLDSIVMTTKYYRVKDVVDTLVLRMVPRGASTKQAYGVNWPVFPNDTTFIDRLSYDQASQKLVGYTEELKIPLTSEFYADSGEYNHIVAVETNWTIPASSGGVFSVEVSFIPGDSTKHGDIIGKDVNGFRVRSFELEGKNSFPQYIKRDYNCSHYVNKIIRYNTAGGWNGAYLPMLAYGETFGWESYAMAFKISQDDVVAGVAENGNISVNSIYPNPAEGQATLNYALTNPANISLIISDVTGKVVLEINEGLVQNGAQSMKINTAELVAGYYNYTLSDGINAITKVLVVK